MRRDFKNFWPNDYHPFIGPWRGGSFAPFQPVQLSCVRGADFAVCCFTAEVLCQGCQCDNLGWWGLGELRWATWAPRNWPGTYQSCRPVQSLATSPRRSSRSRWWCRRDRMRSLCRQLEERSRVSWMSAKLHQWWAFSKCYTVRLLKKSIRL